MKRLERECELAKYNYFSNNEMGSNERRFFVKDDIKTIQSVQRAIDIMKCIERSDQKMTLKQISTQLDLHINTVRGLAQTLLANGFLSKDVEFGTYTLGHEFLTKSKLVTQQLIQRIQEIAYPHMVRISETYGVSSWLQISFYREIYTVEVVEAPGSHYSYAPKSGATLPLHASASGKLRIAFMPEQERNRILDSIPLEPLTEYTITDRKKFADMIERVHAQGYATELEETDVGISCVGVPLFDYRGTLNGTLSAVAPSVRMNKILNEMIVDLKQAGSRISDVISYRRRSSV